VKTKFSKTFTTYFFPVGDEIREIVADWVTYLEVMGWLVVGGRVKSSEASQSAGDQSVRTLQRSLEL